MQYYNNKHVYVSMPLPLTRATPHPPPPSRTHTYSQQGVHCKKWYVILTHVRDYCGNYQEKLQEKTHICHNSQLATHSAWKPHIIFYSVPYTARPLPNTWTVSESWSANGNAATSSANRNAARFLFPPVSAHVLPPTEFWKLHGTSGFSTSLCHAHSPLNTTPTYVGALPASQGIPPGSQHYHGSSKWILTDKHNYTYVE